MTRPIALFLRDIRLRSSKTQKEFAQELGFEQAEISAFELGTRKPTDALLSKLSDLIELSVEEKVEMQEALEDIHHKTRQREPIRAARHAGISGTLWLRVSIPVRSDIQVPHLRRQDRT